ncbi:hypothetical protein [Clostridium formicaceticum]|uniref:Uncharacterized protein n=1 Tax=Clostridium formicaceticum TaxID=1497 RepID=A0AAC9WGB0_9CLOT|nr:hypothetical protein [Clostridium formicaceticum]AOY77208.1 hypothetical protein BJL90_15940 [Clostridium formicaceticum]ARE87733.1 hypothetical protein CLFO_21330 [Clostridium formicaceticum]
MKTKTKTIIKTIYIANDGSEFNSEEDCLYYEEEKKQENLEKEVDEKLGIKTHADFPAMLNLRHNHEYKLFLIKNEEDLDLFVKVYEYWFTQLERYWQVNKETFVYPEVLCILDFPQGGDEHRLYKISQLCSQFNSFVNEITVRVEEKI